MANYYYNIQTKVVDADSGVEVSSAVTSAKVSPNGVYVGTGIGTLVIGGTLSAWISTSRHMHVSASIASGYEFVKHSFYCSKVSTSYQTQEFTDNPMGTVKFANYTVWSANTSIAKALLVVLTIYVRAQTVTVTFEPNGGSVSPTSTTVIFGKAYGSLPTPTKSGGYTFVGWYTDQTEGSVVTATTIVTATSDHTLWAHWNDPVPVTVTVTFDANGGSVSPSSRTVTVGQEYGYLPIPTRSGYVCTGWYTSAAGGEVVEDTTIVTKSYSHSIYAQWTQSGSHMKYDTDAKGIRLYNPPRFLFADRKTTTILGLPDDVELCFSPIYLQCVICQNTTMGKTYDTSTIVFFIQNSESGYYINATGSIGSSSIAVSNEPDNHGGQLGFYRGVEYSPNKVVLAFDETALRNGGYKAYGWCWGTRSKEGGASQGYWNGITNMHLQGGASIDIPSAWLTGMGWEYAVFCMPLVRRLDYLITFNPNGGSIVSGTYFKRVYTGGTYGSMPTPTRAGFLFDGWYTEQVGGTIVIESTQVTNFTDHMLWAHWSSIPLTTYTITFIDPSETNASELRTFTRDVASNLPLIGSGGLSWNNPTGKNYSTSQTWTTRVPDGITYANGATVINLVAGGENLDLYANWNRNIMTVTFDPTGGTTIEPVRNVPYGGQIGMLPTASYTGKSLLGWYTEQTGGTKIDSTQVVISNVTYYAQWEVASEHPLLYIKYTMNLVTNGGVISAEYGAFKYVYGYDKYLPTNEQITKSGYTFGGWYETASFSGSPVTFIVAGSKGKKTFYAKWI